MIYCIDVETTGLSSNDQVIELAWIKLPIETHYYTTDKLQSALIHEEILDEHVYLERFNPSVPINKHAQAIHGISKLKLLRCRPSSEFKLPEDAIIYIGHNVAFDKRMLKIPEHKSICTASLAKKIEKLRNGKFGFDNYQLFTMFCFFYPELEVKFKTTQHNALVDCRMTVLVLIKLLEAFPFISSIPEVYNYFYEKT
jgi:DNA polymerase III epsilon subunit-like protein